MLIILRCLYYKLFDSTLAMLVKPVQRAVLRILGVYILMVIFECFLVTFINAPYLHVGRGAFEVCNYFSN